MTASDENKTHLLKVLDRFLEVTVLGLLTLIVIKGDGPAQAVAGTVFAAVLVGRSKDRTARQTGLGSVRPPAIIVSDNDDDDNAPPPVDRTGFTGQPPPTENGPSDPPNHLSAIVAFMSTALAFAIVSLAAIATGAALASCASTSGPSEAAFVTEITRCREAARGDGGGWSVYLPCRAKAIGDYEEAGAP